MESSDDKKRPFAVEIPLGEKTQDLNAIRAVLDPKIEKLNECKDSFQKITYDSAIAKAVSMAASQYWANNGKPTLYRTEVPNSGDSAIIETYHFKTRKEALSFCSFLNQYNIKHKRPELALPDDSEGSRAEGYIPSLSTLKGKDNGKK
jgi:hypothetical protein